MLDESIIWRRLSTLLGRGAAARGEREGGGGVNEEDGRPDRSPPVDRAKRSNYGIVSGEWAAVRATDKNVWGQNHKPAKAEVVAG